ncbi:MAG: hypothetical protein ACOZCO_09410 [Bacteroidota bacterium]
MKKSIVWVVFLMLVTTAHAQKKPLVGTAKSDILLMIHSTEGNNGCSVFYIPERKLYYTFYAGNSDYPLEIFNDKGKNIYSQPIGIDARGLWYNPKSKKLEGIAYGKGFFSIELTAEGYPLTPVYINQTVTFAGDQQVACFSPAHGEIYQYSEGVIYTWSRKKLKKKSAVTITGLPESPEMINSTSLIYTGYKGYEFGLLNWDMKKIYLFDKSGKYTFAIDLPGSAVTNDVFRFSYANDRVFLYNVDTRTWTGYPVFF